MATNMEYKGERLSFFKLFSDKKYKVVIPIIQRDYAHGRENDDTKEVRVEFLNTLYTYLNENKPNRDLDFIYGTISSGADSDGRTHFIPLDGQQRLTTLFLLHWFLYQISTDEKLKENFKSNLMSGNKSLFTYETRQSSTDFCDALMRSEIKMDKLVKIKGNDGKLSPSLSETIKNEPWFFRIWKNDPTIQSMLVVLDAIYDKFYDKKEFLERLMDVDNPVITFIFMNLKEYKLTDDLYIKMNSRGKPLSKFENFKAKFEQYLQKFDNEQTQRQFVLKFNDKETEVSLRRYFSYNIDTKWTTLLWQYCKDCKDGKQTKLLDSYIENLIRVIITNQYATTASFTNKATSNEAFDVLISDVESLSFNSYDNERVKVLSPDSILAVIDTLDALYNGNDKIRHYISDNYKSYYDEDVMFQKAIENKLTRPERMQFYAYTQYLVRYRDNTNGIDDWMRVIHNLTHPDNTITDNNSDLSRRMKSIKELLDHAPKIIEYLKGSPKIDGFSGHQSDEECVKAWLVEKEDWRELIEDAEKHPYFNGQIGFILEFSGICEYYKNAENTLNFWKEENDRYRDSFKRYAEIAKFVFDLENGVRHNDREDYCFERAVLSKGDYLMKKGEYKNLLSTETSEKNVKRDLSWKRLLRMGDGTEEQKKVKGFVKETFDEIIDTKDIPNSLKSLCVPQNKEKWRDVLISSPEMFAACEKGFIHFSQTGVRLIGQWFLNNYHYELFTYKLWKDKLEDKFKKYKGLSAEYSKQKRLDIIPSISISGIEYMGHKYDIDISTVPKVEGDFKVDFKNFKIAFKIQEEVPDYTGEICSILQSLQFTKNVQDNNWCFEDDDVDGNQIFNKVKELIDKLHLEMSD